MKEKVSIIIPAYNVEKYIEKCVRSVMEQTYENIEILVVDDGSTDRSKEILDHLSEEDCRVKIFHRHNQGVSTARNIGLNESTGEYIVFVDGDDYISKDFVAYMMQLVHITHGEFCLSKNCFTQKNEPQIQKDHIEKLSNEQATALLISPRVIVGCWNKIFKKSFLVENNLKFSSDLFYGEGLNFIIESAQRASIVGVGERKCYSYRRNNEMSATTKFNIQKYYCGEKSLNEIKKNLIVDSELVDCMWLLHKTVFSLGAVVKIKQNHLVKQYKEDYKRWLKYIRKNTPILLSKKEVSLYRKCLLIGGMISPGMMSVLDFLRRKRIAKKSVV